MRNGSWKFTVQDFSPPVVHGDKYCVNNRSDDGYGSNKLYKTYTLDDLFSASDDCDATSSITNVWFNRSREDSQNIVSNNKWTRETNEELSNCPWTHNEKWTIDFETIPGKIYMLIVSARQTECAPVLTGDTPSYIGLGYIKVDGGATRSRTIAPPRRGFSFKEYREIFQAKHTVTKLSLESSQGVLFALDDLLHLFANSYPSNTVVQATSNPTLNTFLGSGQWAAISVDGREPNCNDMVNVIDLAQPCSEFLVTLRNGRPEKYKALPIITDDRLCSGIL
eukprot:TRINITY_DN989_c0_g1_i1.p1 TRINITY_DN989_c0_g1~~TRINITY_DN989_c0_g1_i1.p1  ORF type:complete len:298 (-),score=54.81 TRINITY_DN989_c0_g1_i1:199-1038(-)